MILTQVLYHLAIANMSYARCHLMIDYLAIINRLTDNGGAITLSLLLNPVCRNSPHGVLEIPARFARWC